MKVTNSKQQPKHCIKPSFRKVLSKLYIDVISYMDQVLHATRWHSWTIDAIYLVVEIKRGNEIEYSKLPMATYHSKNLDDVRVLGQDRWVNMNNECEQFAKANCETLD